MKQVRILFFSLAALLLAAPLADAQTAYTRDSLSMTPGYAMDVYYSFADGVTGTADRSSWDIAFRAYAISAAILANDGGGTELYAWPNGDISDWSTVDTNGLSTWPRLYNSPTDWEEGAFNANATDHPDYGWGTYQPTHNMLGDSVFVIKTVDGVWKKIAILSKTSLANLYVIRYANLDGSMDTTINVDASGYTNKNFAYFHIGSHSVIDLEPASEDWDIVFTKYYDEVAPGSYYGVTGVLQNMTVPAARYVEGDTASNFWELDSLLIDKNRIGWDWKAFSMTTFMYEIDDSMYFFVQDFDGNVYKLVFEGFQGSSTGKVWFRKALMSPAGMAEMDVELMQVYPNPAKGELSVLVPERFTEATLRVFTQDGRMVIEQQVEAGELRLDISSLSRGLYMVELSDGSQRAVSKVLVH